MPLLILVLLFFTSSAWADTTTPPVLLWGFQRGCEQLTEQNQRVQRELEANGIKPVELLVPSTARLGCQGPACAEQVLRECRGVKDRAARILGGYVEQNKALTITRVRMWLYDTATGQTAWLDNYCQSCSLSAALPFNAQEIIQNPQFGRAVDVVPEYCRPDASSAQRPARDKKIFWVVYGKEHHKSAITAILRKQIQSAGTEEPLDYSGKDYSLPVFKKIVAKNPTAQVFGAEIQGTGTVELFLFDGTSQLSQNQIVECPACTKDELIEKVRLAGAQLLSHCFGDNCGGTAAGTSGARPSAEACQPFPAPSCGPRAATAALGEPGIAETARLPEISSRLARIWKGTAWATFVATSVASGALFAANATGAGDVMTNRGYVSDTLLPAAGAMAGAAVLSLCLAIPSTIIADRASPKARSVPTPETPTLTKATGLQCPNY